MAAPSPVLYALHTAIEPRGFENLCVDLLVREGYSRIIPGGKSRDHGRDAEVRYWMESGKGAPQIAFQFSLDKKWEPKLRRDIVKIRRECKTIEKIVFVSNRSITIEKQDHLRREFREREGLVLEILDEGWFRVRLEEEHVDLAKKHLGVTVEATPGFYASRVIMRGLTDENQEEILRHTSPETLRATLRAQTVADPTNAGAWKGLAHVCYYLHEYEDALLAASRSLVISRDEIHRWNLTALKASIIAEQGIQSGSRLLLKQAQALFSPFVDRLGRAIDHYNLANILGALKERDAAERHYRRSLELDPSYAQGWKNLGSLLFELNRPEEGMACLNLALHLQPNLLEALCTKANVLVMTSESCAEAISLMKKAFEIDPDLERRWPHAHYWYAMALCRENRLEEALAVVEDRLDRKLDCRYLGRLATDILGKLWREDADYLCKAEAYFKARIDPQERDYRALSQLLDLLFSMGRESEAWKTFDRFLDLEALSTGKLATRIGVSIADFTDAFASVEFYKAFRRSSPLVDYAAILGQHGLEPHKEIPSILFHLLLVSYFKLAAVWQDSDPETCFKEETDALRETYDFISRALAGLGGWLLAPARPDDHETRVGLISAGIIVGLDIPLMETSRLLGYLSGVADRPIPESHRDTVIAMTENIHQSWITAFLRAVGTDWQIEPFLD